MPIVNIYLSPNIDREDLQNYISVLQKDIYKIRQYIANKLSCNSLKLLPKDVSIRIMKIEAGLMIAPVEVSVIAYKFQERIEKQDELARDFKKYFKNKILGEDVRVWLELCELGHSL